MLDSYLSYSKHSHDPKVIKAIKKNLSGVSSISSERLIDEFQKLLKSDGFLKLTKDKGLFRDYKSYFSTN